MYSRILMNKLLTFSGYKQSAKLTVTIHQSKYTIRKIGNSNTFKPGLPFDILVSVETNNIQALLINKKMCRLK